MINVLKTGFSNIAYRVKDFYEEKLRLKTLLQLIWEIAEV